MIKIITIDREYGSGAADIAAKLAERPGWKLWDELLTIEIAQFPCHRRHVIHAPVKKCTYSTCPKVTS